MKNTLGQQIRLFASAFWRSLKDAPMGEVRFYNRYTDRLRRIEKELKLRG